MDAAVEEMRQKNYAEQHLSVNLPSTDDTYDSDDSLATVWYNYAQEPPDGEEHADLPDAFEAAVTVDGSWSIRGMSAKHGYV